MPAPAVLPQPVLTGHAIWPLHDAAASRQVEAEALAGEAPGALMERAGLAVARLALAIAPHAQRVWVAAGPGNNGGDGLVAARHLHRLGRSVHVTLLGDAARLPADAAQALLAAREGGVTITDARPADTEPELAIDALLGLGATRAPQGAIAEAIDRLNGCGARCLAVDLPSGLHPDTGQPLGAAVVRATHTLALLTLKPGLVTGAGRDFAGDLWLDPLGADLSAWPAATRLAGDADLSLALPARRHAAHKGSFGDLAVVGGAAGMTGAAWLAARAALAAGAGRVFVDLLGDGPMALDPARPELMVRPGWWRGSPQALARSTVVCGCGGGEAVRPALPVLLARAARLVLDADALNQVAADAALQAALVARAARGLPTVLTPHPLEAARLLGRDAATVQADRIAAARELAAAMQCTVLLKGSGSVVATPDGRCVVNPTGNALLATGGTGDVLAGWVGGLWAQQPEAAADAARATVASAWLHGRAADVEARHRGWGVPLRAADLIDSMRALQAGAGAAA